MAEPLLADSAGFFSLFQERRAPLDCAVPKFGTSADALAQVALAEAVCRGGRELLTQLSDCPEAAANFVPSIPFRWEPSDMAHHT